MAAFSGALAAVRFCHAAQVALMFARWPPEAREVCGPTEAAPDGRLLFAGPRLAMAVHDTYAYQCAPFWEALGLQHVLAVRAELAAAASWTGS